MTHLGWECPKCGTVYAPWVVKCGTCKRAKAARQTPENTHTCVPGNGNLCVICGERVR